MNLFNLSHLVNIEVLPESRTLRVVYEPEDRIEKFWFWKTLVKKGFYMDGKYIQELDDCYFMRDGKVFLKPRCVLNFTAKEVIIYYESYDGARNYANKITNQNFISI